MQITPLKFAAETAASLIKAFVQSFDMLGLDDVRPVQMRGGLEDDARPHWTWISATDEVASIRVA